MSGFSYIDPYYEKPDIYPLTWGFVPGLQLEDTPNPPPNPLHTRNRTFGLPWRS